MQRCRSPLVLALATLLMLVVTVLAAGCSADPPQPRWQAVTSGSFGGAATQRLDLGTSYLSGRVRVAWDLSGPRDARAEFLLEASRPTDANTIESGGSSVRSWKENFAPRSEAALKIGGLEPDSYRVTLTQRLPRRARVGFAGTFTLYTQDPD